MRLHYRLMTSTTTLLFCCSPVQVSLERSESVGPLFNHFRRDWKRANSLPLVSISFTVSGLAKCLDDFRSKRLSAASSMWVLRPAHVFLNVREVVIIQ